MNKRRGLSPVIATVLLIAMVVVIGLIIFLWFRGISQEAITKFDGTNIELVCDQVYFEASYSNGMIYISNDGNVPIFGMKMQIFRAGSHETIERLEGWPDLGINQGGTYSQNIYSQVQNSEKIILVPVLIGSSKGGERTFMCDEKQYGYEISI